MLSQALADGSSAVTALGTIAGTVISVAAVGSLAAGLTGKALRRRRTARAHLLKTGWQAHAEVDKTGALIYNESSTDFKDVVLTVACVLHQYEARQDIGLLRAKQDRVWPTPLLHEILGSMSDTGASDPVDLAHHASPHTVQATFTDGRGYWFRSDGRIERVKTLVLWAEKTRASTLQKYFGPRSPFTKQYSVKVTVYPFDRIEELERAFTELVRTGRTSGDAPVPDIIVGPHDWIGRVAREDSVLEPPAGTQRMRSVAPSAVRALSRGRRLYAVPYVFDTVALIRNNALTGRTQPMPESAEEAIRLGREALAAKGIQDGIPFALQIGAPNASGDAGDPYHMWPLFSSAGGSFFGLRHDHEDGFADPDDWRPGFTEAFVELARLGQGANGDRALDPALSRAEALAAFLAGRAPYFQCSSRALASIRERGMDVTVAPAPRLGAGRPEPMVSVYGFFIYRGAPNLPAARDLLTAYVQTASAGLDLQRHQQLVPVQEEAMTAVAAGDPVLRPYVEQVRTGFVMPSYPEMREAWRLLGRTEYDVLVGGEDPREVAERVADRGWELLRDVR
ncbi:MAG: extracellular solute-binding protein [Catenulispora sp.]|nr:extracellular solute-binding protein [Catenulispora sp.]